MHPKMPHSRGATTIRFFRKEERSVSPMQPHVCCPERRPTMRPCVTRRRRGREPGLVCWWIGRLPGTAGARASLCRLRLMAACSPGVIPGVSRSSRRGWAELSQPGPGFIIGDLNGHVRLAAFGHRRDASEYVSCGFPCNGRVLLRVRVTRRGCAC